MLRQGRASMADFGDHDYDLLTDLGWGTGQGNRRAARKTASIAGAPGATAFFLSGWAEKPMGALQLEGPKEPPVGRRDAGCRGGQRPFGSAWTSRGL